MPTRSATKNPARALAHPGRYVLVGTNAKDVPEGVVVCRRAGELGSAVRDAPRKRVFVSYGRRSTEELLQAGLALGRHGRMGTLLTLEPPRPESVPSLSGLFERVVGAAAGYRWLPLAEVPVVLSAKDSADRFLGGAADPRSRTLALVRGDLTSLVVPFAFFRPSGDGTKPDFSRLAFADYGLTMALGPYEASADGILYEFDAAYRQKLRKERLKTDQSFGSALRRLRLQRGLKRGDFAPVTAKTIARIERGEVERPHRKTLETLAQRLSVAPDEIETY